MAENEKVVEETTEKVVEETTQQEQPKEETPKVDLSKFESKDDDNVAKIDLSNPPKIEEKIEEEKQTEEATEEVVKESVVEEVKE